MAELFNIHMASDLSEWTSTVTDGDDLAWSADAGLVGTSGGMRLLIDDTTMIYAQKTVTTNTSGHLRFRFYVNPNNLSRTPSFQFTTIKAYNSSDNNILQLDFFGDVAYGEYEFFLSTWTDAGTQVWTSPTSFAFVGTRCIEIYLSKSSGANDGKLQIWCDGKLMASRTDVDNDVRFGDFSYIRFGAGVGDSIDADTSGTFYLDEIVANDDGGLIGPVVTPNNVTKYWKYGTPINSVNTWRKTG